MSTAQPTLFVPHGAPTFALRPGAAGAALRRLAATLAPPRAVVIASPHWNTAQPAVGLASRPETIHDFWGFPAPLYEIRYPATGCPEAAREVAQALAAAELPVELDAQRGLDHGAWVPLRLMFPDAEVPVIPLSVQGHAGPEHALRVGATLAPLAKRGFLIVGSGSLTHNLRDFQTAVLAGGKAPAYVHDFAEWIAERLAERDIAALLDYRRRAPEGARAHPSEEHLLPLFIALGAAADDASIERSYAGVDDHVIAMDAYTFRPQ